VRITAVRDVVAPVSSTIRNAKINFSQMTCSVVRVTAEARGRSFTGYGYTSNGRYAQSGLLRERFIPRLLAADPAALTDDDDGLDPTRVRTVLMQNEKPGGHGERSVAVGALEMAAWDLAAKIAGLPGYQYIARRLGRPEPVDRVVVYAAGGYYYPDSTVERLRTEIRGYVDAGYSAVKMKIGGAPLDDDLERVAAAMEAAGPTASVAVDANGAMSVETAIAYGRALSELGARWFEEPVDPLDYAGLAEVAAGVSVPIATGENLFSWQDVRNLLLFGGLDRETAVLQMDPVLSYGLAEFMDTLDVLAEQGWSPARCFPHGGNHLSLAMTTALGLGAAEVYPVTFQPFGVVTGATRLESGTLRLPDVPGLGVELKAELAPILRELD
jgi:L-alanine-DL-glutamate epimerase-like enolase superfamily enzyme